MTSPSAPRRASTSVQPEVFYWDPPNEKAGSSVANRAKLYDAVDLVWRNRVGETYNINADLWRIRSRTMVMHITNDQWLNFKLAERAVDRIPGADLIAEESPVAHYGVFSIINHRKNDPKFVAFMDDVASLDRAQQFVDKNYRVPGVAANIDPNKSFWKDYVTYPYPVKYADREGRPRHLLADRLHGRICRHRQGSEGARHHPWQGRVRRPLRQHHAVCAAQRPARDRARSAALRHVRTRAISTRARRGPCRTCATSCTTSWSTSSASRRRVYLGHSLGGQLVMGYALTWPDAVQGLALEAPAGLEEYPREVTIAPGKTAASVRRLLRARFRQVEADLGPDRHPRCGNRAAGAEHPRLLLLQEARSRRPASCRRPRAATS